MTFLEDIKDGHIRTLKLISPFHLMSVWTAPNCALTAQLRSFDGIECHNENSRKRGVSEDKVLYMN